MATDSIKSIHDLLNQARARIKQPRDLGTWFEKLIKSYLENDPIYKERYHNVSMWTEWEHCWGPDLGIDLVAETNDGDFIAIQCKFYDETYEFKKEDINSFLAESSKNFKVKGKQKSFSQRIVFSTSDNWSENADKTLQNQTPAVIRLRVADLDESPIDWSKFSFDNPGKITLKEKKKPRPHQNEAITKVINGFKSLDRGKLIMACGTGKTFTALKLTETYVKKDGIILFLVPSISLLSQTLREWTAEAELPFHAFAVCSDSKVGKDNEDMSKHELLIPATTDTKSLMKGIESAKKDKRWIVIFSTYQSIDVVSKAQKQKDGLPEFDLVICDEAHRTTGVTLADKDDSHFVKIHDQKFIQAKKRLYMTATPRVFGDAVKSKAKEASADLASMDDETKFGPEFHRLGFGKAVNDGLLTDYKVLILAVDQKIIPENFQKSFADDNGELQVDDYAKIIGCWNGLSKRLIGEGSDVESKNPMRKAVAFARSIKDSKRIANAFQTVVKEYIQNNNIKDDILDVEVHHVDGSYNVLKRNKELDWIKEDTENNECRILTNARCLSEGVDVPALDAVLFLNSRDSQVDVVQSVGRIMRRSEGKKFGYIILPIVVPTGEAPEQALADNKKYKVVWQILQALRAHDDRFDAIINQMDLNKKSPKNIDIIGVGGGSSDEDTSKPMALPFPEIEEWRDAIYAKIVLKCGSRPYWENWASDVAKIAEKHTEQIKKILKSDDSKTKKEFSLFLDSIKKNINPSISENDAIEMLSQHLITKPIFDALFGHFHFTDKNPVSKSMQKVLNILSANFDKSDTEKLKTFYDSVKLRVRGIDNPEGRQKIIVELYDRFFKVAFPKMASRLGIVYTPIEVVDFIIHSVEAILKKEFNQSIADKGVNVLDPFTGTGTFIVRLLQSGIISSMDLKEKFKDLHANEIVLLAYYIASINIEETYHAVTGENYLPFEGIALTDTFQLNEDNQQPSFKSIIPENSERVEKQKKAKISIIIGNPPYSAGQADVNDNNQNIKYPNVDFRIKETYARLSSAKNKNSLYDSYIRSLRWASDRIGSEGVIGFITNGSFIDAKSADGIRKTLYGEFYKVYCFNLRGNQYTSGENSLKEGGKIFGSGSRAPIAITILVKDIKRQNECNLYYYDIGDYHSREDKLKIISDFKSIDSINWEMINPNDDGDWINHRGASFDKSIPIFDENNPNSSIFSFSSLGINTSRDAWTLNFSIKELEGNIKKLIKNYNSEVDRYEKVCRELPSNNFPKLADFVEKDQKKISWSSSLLPNVARGRRISFDPEKIIDALCKPFFKQKLYFDNFLIHRISKNMQLFPTPAHFNIVISLTGLGVVKDFSCIASNFVPASKLTENGQCFSLYYYEEKSSETESALLNLPEVFNESGFVRKNSITNFALKKFQETYIDESIDHEAIFYYIYGILHSEDYRKRSAVDLKKVLPRIPFVTDFWEFSNKGKALALLHLNYETIDPYPLVEEIKSGSPKKEKELYHIDETGMKWFGGKKNVDKTQIIFNQYVTLKGIPLNAYDYVVNGKSALEWIMERYTVTVDLNSKGEGSGIKNDPNEWSSDPRYIIDLVKRVISVSIESNKIISKLPPLNILP